MRAKAAVLRTARMLHGLWRPQVIATACHTVGHVSFLVGDAGPTARAAIFTGAPDAYKLAPTRNTQRTRNTQHADATRNTQTQHAGDAVFAGGCGKFFEGGEEEMRHTIERAHSTL
jgi:hypothetical protein